MSKEWYYEVMGTAVGPISSAELKRRAQLGQIGPDTPVRLGTEGKWQPAERVKGLLDPPPPPPPTLPSSAPVFPTVRPSSGTIPVVAVSTAPAPAASAAVGATYSVPMEAGHPVDPDELLPHEYDFFRLVGFEQAIGTALHQVLVDHCRNHGLTFTEVTKRALAEFLGRKDLLESPEKTPGGEAEKQPAPDSAPA
uniref:DUF4339 domain-containing protein n=1 Tax=Schlesneria paludicola TaxID=360056 RepID=A0A7C4LL94_9PLAN